MSVDGQYVSNLEEALLLSLPSGYAQTGMITLIMFETIKYWQFFILDWQANFRCEGPLFKDRRLGAL